MSNTETAAVSGFNSFCGECGGDLAGSLKFCAGCGTASAASPGASATARQATANDEDADQVGEGAPSLSLWQGWGCYGLGYVSLATLVWIRSPYISIPAYLCIGIMMSRFVMRRLVQWHPLYNTLHNVVSAKFWMVMLWPLNMLILLVKLSANRLL